MKPKRYLKPSQKKQLYADWKGGLYTIEQIAQQHKINQRTAKNIIETYMGFKINSDSVTVRDLMIDSFAPKENDVTEDELLNPKFLTAQYWQVKHEMPYCFKEQEAFETLTKFFELTENKKTLYDINKEYKLITDMDKFNTFVKQLKLK